VSELSKVKPADWPAYGPEKDAWKKAGNYFTAEELARMAEDFKDLTITIPPETIYDAN
jgi:hypothetical protein